MVTHRCGIATSYQDLVGKTIQQEEDKEEKVPRGGGQWCRSLHPAPTGRAECRSGVRGDYVGGSSACRSTWPHFKLANK